MAPTAAGCGPAGGAAAAGDVGGNAERLERLVHGHRVGAGGDGEGADAVGVGERGGDRGEPRDLGAAAGDEEHVVVVVLDRERAQLRFELGHTGSLRPGELALRVPPV